MHLSSIPNFRRFAFTAILYCLLLSGLADTSKADADIVADDAIRALILDTIRQNPEIVVEAIRTLHAQEQKEQAKAAKKALSTYHTVLEQDPSAPVGGNPKGDVTIVEFFDYRCGYCKRVFPKVVELLADDANIRWVFKEFPILGPDSRLAARAALAVWNIAPEKYWNFHTTVMASGGAPTKNKLFAIARDSGVDETALENAMKDGAIQESLQRNLKLAQALGIGGTPAFVIGDKIIRGAVGIEEFKSLIAEVRKG